MIRVTTEHNGVREFPDDHVPEILEAATLHVMDGAGKTVLLVAEGEWRSVEIDRATADPKRPPSPSDERRL